MYIFSEGPDTAIGLYEKGTVTLLSRSTNETEVHYNIQLK